MSLILNHEQRGNRTLLSVAGRMDAVTAPDFEKACTGLLNEGKTDVVAELTDLKYISSAGLRSFLCAAKKLKASGGNLRFCGLSGMVQEVFRVSGFQSMFTVAGSFEELVKKG